jgi:hypothetical protein
MFALLSLIVSAYAIYEVVKGRSRPSLWVLISVNVALTTWNMLS